MRPILFELGPLTVSSFGMTMSLAFIVAGIVMQHDFPSKGEPADLA